MNPTTSASTTLVDGLSVHRRAPLDHTGAAQPMTGAPTVVFVHGAADRGAAFARVGRHLPGLQLVRFDRRGYGRSVGAPPPQVTGSRALLEAQIDDLLAVVAATSGDGPLVIVGHSLGGLVALGAAVRAPGVVNAVVAYEPPTPWESWWGRGQAGTSARSAADATGTTDGADRGAAAMEAFLRKMIGDDRWDALGPQVQQARHAEGPALLADLEAARGAGDLDLDALDIPVILGVGTMTTARHLRAVDVLAGRMAGAEVVVIEGADHGAHMTHAAELASMVDRALAQLNA